LGGSQGALEHLTQLVEADGLLEPLDHSVRLTPGILIEWVTGHGDDLDARVASDELSKEGGAAHLGHDEVTEDESNATGVFLALAERFAAVWGCQGAIVEELQAVDQRLPGRGIVFHHKDDLAGPLGQVV
jgi:hypothetical protein